MINQTKEIMMLKVGFTLPLKNIWFYPTINNYKASICQKKMSCFKRTKRLKLNLWFLNMGWISKSVKIGLIKWTIIIIYQGFGLTYGKLCWALARLHLASVLSTYGMLVRIRPETDPKFSNLGSNPAMLLPNQLGSWVEYRVSKIWLFHPKKKKV